MSSLLLVNNPFGNTTHYHLPGRTSDCVWTTVAFVFMATFDVPMLEAHLEAIRLLSSEEVQVLAVQVLPLDRLPLGYLHQVSTRK